MTGHRVFYMDALIVKYAADGVTPLHCDIVVVETRRGDKSDAYGCAVKYLQERGMVESGWRVSAVDYPDTLEDSMLKLAARCARNRWAARLKNKED